MKKCPYCHSEFADQATFCPNCGTKLTASSDATSQRFNTPPTRPTPPAQPRRPSYYVEPEKKQNTWVLPVLLGLLALLLIGGGAYWYFTNQKDAETEITAQTEQGQAQEQTQEQNQAQEREQVQEQPAKSEDSTPADTPSPTRLDSSDPSTSIFNAISNGTLGITPGMTADRFAEIMAGNKSKNPNMILYNNPRDGFRYQYFFDGNVGSASNPNSNATLTGVAISCPSSDAVEEVSNFDRLMRNSDATLVGDNMWRTNRDTQTGAGCKNGRFYIYHYMPNATDKSAPPRDA